MINKVKKRIYILLAVVVSFLCISVASAATVPWDRTKVGTQVPLYGDGILVTASSTFLGNITAASLPTGCLTSVSGLFTSVDCSTIGSAFPFTPTTNYNVAVNSTSTPIWFTAGLMASSTSYFPGSGIWNSSGNVGIGTTTPGAKLHVLETSEQLRMGYDASNYASFTTGSAGNLTISSTINSGTNIYSGISSNGIKGWAIGGTDIRGVLTVQKDFTSTYTVDTDMGDAGRIFVIQNNSATRAANQFSNISLQIDPTTGFSAGRVLADIRLVRETSNQSNGYFLFSGFRQGGAYKDFAKIGYDSSYFVGNVGIGTTTPVSLLNVAGATAPKITISDTDASADRKHWFVESSSGVFSIGTTSDALVTNATYRAFAIDTVGEVGIGIVAPENTLHISTTSAGVVTNGLLLQNRSSTIGTGVSLNFISSATSFSDNRYNSITSINTDGSNGQALTFSTSNGAAPAERLRITAAGNLGIGTTTPGQKLSVAGDILGNRIIGSNFTSTSTTASSTFANGLNLTTGCLAYNGTCLSHATLGGTTAVANGGTGATTLTGLLQGNATGAFTAITGTAGQFPYYNGTNALLATSTIFLATNGNVGVGTTTPGSLLSVAGDAYLSGFYNTSQTTGGYKMSGSVVLTASSTSGLTLGGLGAGSALLATTTAAGGNTAFGYNAMTTATSTRAVTAIGYRALANLNDCTAAGAGASTCLLTAVGYNALAANTTGYWNTALGANALAANTTGTQNIGLGSGALLINTTGSANIAIGGTGALASNVSGSLNVAIGQQSLTANTGSNNTGVGTYAGFYNTSGSTNTFIGKEAGMGNLSVTNDSNSVIDTNMLFLGYRAAKDRYGLASTSVMTNSAAIGANSVVGASNAIALGGLGSNAVKVGIGSSTPFAKLSLHAYNSETNINLFAIGSSTASATTTHLTVLNTGAVYAPNTTSSGSAQTGYWCYDADGQFVRTSTTCLVSASRFKEHVGDLDVGLAELMKLRPVSYFLKDTMGDPNNADQQIGFIAEEAQAVDARLVTRNSEGQVQSFRYEQFTALLTKAIQEQQRQIENLKVGVVEIKRSVEEDWQNFFLLLLFAGLIFQQVQINKLRK